MPARGLTKERFRPSSTARDPLSSSTGRGCTIATNCRKRNRVLAYRDVDLSLQLMDAGKGILVQRLRRGRIVGTRIPAYLGTERIGRSPDRVAGLIEPLTVALFHLRIVAQTQHPRPRQWAAAVLWLAQAGADRAPSSC